MSAFAFEPSESESQIPDTIQIHAPSLHVRRVDGSGFDYEEDLYADGDGLHLVRKLTARGGSAETLLASLVESAAERFEAERLFRIYAGLERACSACGCSETLQCRMGCVWATETLCSRCVR